jgi:hypothetical protein
MFYSKKYKNNALMINRIGKIVLKKSCMVLQ